MKYGGWSAGLTEIEAVIGGNLVRFLRSEL